uniref:Uncharacterized protein n=1 Tax=Oryza barthii TaxID=65489 RepID=A0A0D3GNX1_9ORYZ
MEGMDLGGSIPPISSIPHWFSVEVRVGAYVMIETDVHLRTNQSPSIWFFHKAIGEDVRLVDDSQLPDLFEIKMDGTSEALSTLVENEVEPICVVPPDNSAPIIGSEQPAPNVEGVEKLATEEEPVREPDIFDNEEEYVGVDDEHLYVPSQPK